MWLNRNAWASLLTERARLTAEVKALEELNWRLCEDMARYVELTERERQRADSAVDELLALRGIGPVTPPPKPSSHEDFSRMFEEDEGELAELKKRMEAEGTVAVVRNDGEPSA